MKMQIDPNGVYFASSPEMRAIASPPTLRKLRQAGDGPPAVQIGSRYKYYGRDILDWLATKARQANANNAATA